MKKKFRIREIEVILAEQYLEADVLAGKRLIDGIKLGKCDPNNRWDDTPDGPYVSSDGNFKQAVRDGDWIFIKPGDKLYTVMSDKDFLEKYYEYEL